MPPTHLGVTDVELWVPTKRDVLLFDHIVVGTLAKGLSTLTDEAVRSDWEYLASEGVVKEYKYEIAGRTGALKLDGRNVAQVDLDGGYGKMVEEQAAVAGLAVLYASRRQNRPPSEADLLVLTDFLNIGKSIDRFAIAEKSVQLMAGFYETAGGAVTMETAMAMAGPMLQKATVRSTAAVLGTLEQYTTSSMVADLGEEHLLLGATKVSDVVDILLLALPVPDELTPWETILDFRRDEETRMQLARLGRWMRDAGRRLVAEEVTRPALQDELASMTESYRDHMKVHRLKAGTSVVETIVTLAGEFAENVLKLRLKALAKSLFEFRHRRIALMEAELEAPGRELAYIVSAGEKFGAG